jgi:tetratricopeptide (TPR) repeat protein
MSDLALVLGFQNRFDEAQELYGQALRIQERILGPDHLDTLQTLCYLANACQDAGELDRADRLLRDLVRRHRHLGESNPFQMARALSMLGLNLLSQRRYAEAEPVLRECLALREQKLPDHWNRSNAASMLGEALLGQGRPAEAEPLLLRGYADLKRRESRIPDPGKIRLAQAAERLVRLYESTRRPERARAWLETVRQERDNIEATRGGPAGR